MVLHRSSFGTVRLTLGWQYVDGLPSPHCHYYSPAGLYVPGSLRAQRWGMDASIRFSKCLKVTGLNVGYGLSSLKF